MSDINIGKLIEIVNNKADRDLSNVKPESVQDIIQAVDQVIEYKKPTSLNGYTWYRKYESGWVEQGGQLEIPYYTNMLITLPIEMQNANYSCSISSAETSVEKPVELAICGNNTMTVKIMNFDSLSNVNVYWEVKGIAK